MSAAISKDKVALRWLKHPKPLRAGGWMLCRLPTWQYYHVKCGLLISNSELSCLWKVEALWARLKLSYPKESDLIVNERPGSQRAI